MYHSENINTQLFFSVMKGLEFIVAERDGNAPMGERGGG